MLGAWRICQDACDSKSEARLRQEFAAHKSSPVLTLEHTANSCAARQIRLRSMRRSCLASPLAPSQSLAFSLLHVHYHFAAS